MIAYPDPGLHVDVALATPLQFGASAYVSDVQRVLCVTPRRARPKCRQWNGVLRHQQLMTPDRCHHRHQGGAMLIEVLVAMLLLSFGMLALGAMLSFSVQMPKLSGYRSAAVNLAASHIDRIRANPGAFERYKTPLHETAWSFEKIKSKNCKYPDCNEASLAAMDDATTRQAVRDALPAGDLLVTCGNAMPCNKNAYGNLWIVWQDPSTQEDLDTSSWDNCPAEVTRIYTQPKPRCMYMRFKL